MTPIGSRFHRFFCVLLIGCLLWFLAEFIFPPVWEYIGTLPKVVHIGFLIFVAAIGAASYD